MSEYETFLKYELHPSAILKYPLEYETTAIEYPPYNVFNKSTETWSNFPDFKASIIVLDDVPLSV